MKPTIRLFMVFLLIAPMILLVADPGLAGPKERRQALRKVVSRIFGPRKPGPEKVPPSQQPSAAQDPLASAESWDFRRGIEGGDWNVRLIPTEGPHPGRQLHLPPEQHMDYYLQHSRAIALTPEGLQFTVRPGDAAVAGDKKRFKERAEIGRFGFGQGEKGQTCEYSIRFKLGPGGTIPTGQNFMMITQSHTQRDVDFPGGWTLFVGVAGKDRLKFVYGLNDRQTRLQTKPFPASFGEWHDLTVRVYWTDQRDGWAEVYLDGRQVVSRVSGPNMPTSDAMEWKFGIYRGHKLATVDTLIVQTAEHKVIER
ncbi:MAG: heparin lyase I family protein [Candidatus Omnitrophota bacterium]|nr:heparin lyase I family protein [Candidatus Omnitrophota bacterium]